MLSRSLGSCSTGKADGLQVHPDVYADTHLTPTSRTPLRGQAQRYTFSHEDFLPCNYEKQASLASLFKAQRLEVALTGHKASRWQSWNLNLC